LNLLLDEHVWPGAALLVRKNLPSLQIESLHHFADGRLMNCDDGVVLEEAGRAGCVLVTFDVNTIPALLREKAMAQEHHAGVIFVSSKSFPQNDHQGLARALVELMRSESTSVWTNRVVFLRKPMSA